MRSEPPRHRIPVVIVSSYGQIVGGGEESLLSLLGALDRARWAPLLIVPSEGPVAVRARALGLPVHVVPLPTGGRPGPAMLRCISTLRRLLTATRAALVHANGSPAMTCAGVAGRLAGRPVLWHSRFHARNPLDPVLGALATTVIVVSKAVERRFPWWLRQKLRLVHNGVDLARFAPRPPSPALRRALGVPDHGPLVVAVGRFLRFKGHTHLLDAAGQVQAVRPGVHWLLVGDGELRPDLEAQAQRLGLGPRIHFAGWREDIADVLALADLFVLPSLVDALPRVVLEAMAMGKAVVATDAGGVPELVVDGVTGRLVPPADAPSLAEAVGGLLDDPATAARLGAAGRRRAENHFSLTHHATAIARVYDEVLGATGAQ